MGDAVRIIMSCRNRRRAFSLGKVLMRARLAAAMSIATCTAREPWLSWSRAGSDVPLVLLTRERAVPFIEDRARELQPEDPPPLVGRLEMLSPPGLEAYVRMRVSVPTLH